MNVLHRLSVDWLLWLWCLTDFLNYGVTLLTDHRSPCISMYTCVCVCVYVYTPRITPRNNDLVPCVRRRFFASLEHPDSRTHPPSYSVGSLYTGVKRPRREADHSSPFSAEIENEWSSISTPICLHGVVLN